MTMCRFKSAGWLGLGFGFWLDFGFRLRFSFGFRFRFGLSFGLWLGLDFRLVVQALVFGLRLRPWLQASVRLWLRLGLGFRFVFLNLLLCLFPVLNCLTVLAASLLIEFIGSLGDLRRQVGWRLTFGLRLGFGFRL